ncbi:MAG: TrkA C-terminal domain-containing protein [bacterium]
MNLRIFLVIIILLGAACSCAPTLELTTFAVKENSKVVGKSIASLDWQGKGKISVLKVLRNNKEWMSPKNSFVFAVNDTVYVLSGASQVKYISIFFE